MKEGWEYKKLGEVAEVIHGKNQKDVLSANGTYPIYGSGGNVMGYASDYLCEAGTTILGRKGSINNPLYIKERFWNVDTAFGISAKEGNDGKYLYYFIKNVDWLKKNTGTTLPSLTQQVVKSVVLPVPPLSEQQRIVDYLDSAFAKIDAMKANAEKSLNEAKALFQVSLKEMLEPKEGWDFCALSSVCKVQNGFAFNSKLFNESNNGLPLIRIRDIKRGYSLTYTSEICTDEYFVENGDMLIGMDGDFNIGEWKGGHALLNQRVCKLMPSEKILAKFIFYFIPEALQKINDKTAYSTVKHLSSKQVNAILLPNLPLSELQSIVAALDSLKSKVDRLQANFEKISQECAALKQAILRQVFE